jgi:hypothetical protein
MGTMLPFAVLSLVGAVAGSCGTGGAAAAVRPSAMTAAETVGESCPVVADYGQPLIVDWKAYQRANLEEAMNAGVAVVAYDCHTIRLLGDGHIDGTYGTLGVSRKEEVVELENADEIRANLPTLGVKLAVDLQAELQRGSTLNLAMIMVGKRRTTLSTARRAQLSGSCDGATHFVRGAFMGAFAMATGTRGKVGTSARLFGSDVSADSTSTRGVKNKDGDPSICEQVQPGASSLPNGCNAILRLELSPIATGEEPAAIDPSSDTPSASRAGAACPQGMALSGGKCTRATATQVHDCRSGATEDCAAQCGLGSAASCASLGEQYFFGSGVGKDVALAASLFEKGCAGGSAWACSDLGTAYAHGAGVPRDLPRALALYKKACDAGEPLGCGNLGAEYALGEGVPHDDAQALESFRRACEGGDANGCSNLGAMYAFGHGVTKDATRAMDLFKRACDAGHSKGCENIKQLRDIQAAGAAEASKPPPPPAAPAEFWCYDLATPGRRARGDHSYSCFSSNGECDVDRRHSLGFQAGESVPECRKVQRAYCYYARYAGRDIVCDMSMAACRGDAASEAKSSSIPVPECKEYATPPPGHYLM